MAIHSILSLKEIFFDSLETGKYNTGCIATRKTSGSLKFRIRT